MSLLLNGGDANDILSLFNNPFMQEKITDIWLFNRKPWFGQKRIWKGSIEFENGDTKGKQEFEAPTLPEILAKMENFINAL